MTPTLCHDRAGGYHWLEFAGRPDEATRAALKAAGWRWSSYRKQWYTNHRHPTIPAGIVAEDGGDVDYSAERADRLTERAERVQAQAGAASERAHAIGDGIPLGQPILVGHHSERRHRRDLARIDAALGQAVAGYGYANHLQQRAHNSRDHQAAQADPGTIQRRIERLQAERTALINQRHQWIALDAAEDHATEIDPAAGAGYQERLDWYATEIARAEADLAAAGGPRAAQLNIGIGDVIRWRRNQVRVTKINRKRDGTISSYTGDILDAPYLTEAECRGRVCAASHVTGRIAAATTGEGSA